MTPEERAATVSLDAIAQAFWMLENEHQAVLKYADYMIGHARKINPNVEEDAKLVFSWYCAAHAENTNYEAQKYGAPQ